MGLGNVFDFLFANPFGQAAVTAATGGAQIGEALGSIPRFAKKGPHVASIPKPEDFNALNKTGSKKMPRTLKDVLVEKIAAAQKPAKPVRTLKDVLVEKIASTMRASRPAQRAELPFKITEKDAAFFGEITKTANLAGLGELLKTSPIASGITGAAATGAGLYMGGSVLGSIYDKISDAVKSQMAYSQMFEEFPDLKEMPRAQVDKFWGVLSDFAPKLTINPLVAGQFIQSMVNMGYRGVEHTTAKDLIGIQSMANQGSGSGDIMKFLGGMAGKTHEGLLGAALGKGGQGPMADVGSIS